MMILTSIEQPKWSNFNTRKLLCISWNGRWSIEVLRWIHPTHLGNQHIPMCFWRKYIFVVGGTRKGRKPLSQCHVFVNWRHATSWNMKLMLNAKCGRGNRALTWQGLEISQEFCNILNEIKEPVDNLSQVFYDILRWRNLTNHKRLKCCMKRYLQ